LYAESAGRQLIARRCERAAAAGVERGMTLAHARALLPAGRAVVELHQPPREVAALGALARWALRFSPIVAVDPPDGLLIDIAGCQHLFGGERRLVHLIADTVEGRLGFGARIAAGPTFACAGAMARFGSRARAIVGAGGGREALAALPVAALRVDQAVVDALDEVGIERVGHLFRLPRASLATRFGRGLLLRLDQATGEAPETIDPIRPATPATVERVFAGPVARLEEIRLTVRALVAELSEVLEQREGGARELDLRLDRIDAEPLRLTVGLSRPSRSVEHLWSLLGPKVESINLGYGVERVALSASRPGRIPHQQVRAGWTEGSTVDDARLRQVWGEFLDALSNRLGSDRVVQAEPVETHLPERTFRLRSVVEEERDKGTKGQRDKGKKDARLIDSPQSLCSDRPSLLLERPEPITVIAVTPEGPPSWFRWRDLEQRVVASAGPERIGGEWWDEERGAGAQGRRGAGKAGQRAFGESYARAYGRFMLGRDDAPSAEDQRQTNASQPSCLRASVPPCLPTRDYFKVQDEQGRWLWIYRVLESGGWFVHGLWA
jgi:protein ImuB